MGMDPFFDSGNHIFESNLNINHPFSGSILTYTQMVHYGKIGKMHI